MAASGLLALLPLLSVIGTGCVTATSVSVSQLPEVSDRKHVVTARGSAPIIFGIPFGTSFINEAQADLLAACPGGRIEGVLAKQETTAYFIEFVVVDSVRLQGYCVAGTNKKKQRG